MRDMVERKYYKVEKERHGREKVLQSREIETRERENKNVLKEKVRKKVNQLKMNDQMQDTERDSDRERERERKRQREAVKEGKETERESVEDATFFFLKTSREPSVGNHQ
ncbi:hypothetical protein BgiMline_001027 [Biomphalaria glabrata]